MNTRRLIVACLVSSSVALSACGADQDPALEVPDDATTTTGATEDAAPTSAEVSFGPIQLTGAAEIPGPGAEEGSGVANVYLESNGSICYDFIGIDGLDSPPSAAHIHEGGESESGPVVLPLDTPSEGSLDACAADQAELSARIAENPSNFYVNVHNADFPDGAIRGQLAS